jgi:hypothetical protein
VTKLETAGLVTSGAIIVLGRDDRPALSYIPGCAWSGIDHVPPDAFDVDYLPGTQIAEHTDALESQAANVRNMLWHAAWRAHEHTHRVLMALDAIGDVHVSRVSFAPVVGLGREWFIRTLTKLDDLGYVVRSRESITLRPEWRGMFWDYQGNEKGGSSRPHPVGPSGSR